MYDLTKHAMLIDLSIKKWSASRLDKRITDETKAARHHSGNTGKWSKYLIKPEALKELNEIESAARTEHYRRTTVWDDKGRRALASAGYMDYCKAMRVYQDQWEPAVNSFLANYPTLLDEARIALNGDFDPAQYPDTFSLAKKFVYGYNVLPIPSGDHLALDLNQHIVDRMRAEIDEQMRASARAAMADTWDRMKDVVSKMVERLKAFNPAADTRADRGIFRDSLVENINDLINVLPSLNITGDAAIDDFARRMKIELTRYSPETLRASTPAREETAKAAEEILQQMEAFV